ncbi:MAG: protein jag [Undibacterium sp.]
MEESFRQTLSVIVKDLLKRIGFEAEVNVSEAMVADRVEYHCEITLQDGQNLLIGQHGANVGALLHIVKLAARKSLPKDGVISLDVNHYFEEKKVFLEREAQAAVKEVEASGLPVMLRPMLSFERKLIHHLLSDHPTVMTESVGNGDERKVLIKNRPEAATEAVR